MSGAISALFGLKKTPDELISSSQKHLDVLEANENDSEEYIHVRICGTSLSLSLEYTPPIDELFSHSSHITPRPRSLTVY
jgi:hypothetical protein